MSRHRLPSLLALLAAAWLLALPAAAASAGSGEALQVVDVDTSDHPDVEVRVVAPRPLADHELDGGAFTIIEGGRLREVEATRVTGIDLEAVLVIDTSGSMAGAPLEVAKAAAVDFVEQVPTGSRLAVVAFSGQAQVVTDFTDDPAVVIGAIQSLAAMGGTAVFDAAVAAADLFSGRGKAVRSIILLSDGGDTKSVYPVQVANRRLLSADVVLHGVQLATSESESTGLTNLAASTGGRVTAAEDPAALKTLYEDLARDVGNQYLLRYRSGVSGAADLQVAVDAHGVNASAVEAVDLPPPTGLSSFLASRWALIVGAAACYAALGVVVLLILGPPKTRLAPGRQSTRRGAVSEVADWATALAERSLRRGGRNISLNAALERAGLTLRPGEFLVLAGCAALAATAIGTVFGTLPVGLLLGAGVVVGARLFLTLVTSRRQRRFGDQLSDTLQLLAGGMRAGYSLLQAVDAVGRESDDPTSEEFGRLVVETRLGRDLTDALEALAERVASQDFAWVVQAIAIHRQVGGDLADVLDRVAETIRERNQIRRHVQALSAEGRLSAYVLLALPFGIAGFLTVTNPSYVGELVTNTAGWIMLLAGGVFMTVGALWLRKIVRIPF